MAPIKTILFSAVLTISCGTPEDGEQLKKSTALNAQSADGSGAITDSQQGRLSSKLLSAGAEALRKNSGAAYFEQNDSHLLLALPGIRAVYGDYGLPSYEEKPKCDEQDRCGAEMEYTQAGWAAFFADFLAGLDKLQISYKKGDAVDINKVLEFATNGG